MLAATSSPGVVVLAAPAGSGKTTAAAQLAEAIDGTVIWYRLSAGDAELSVLLRHLLVAVASTLDQPAPEGEETEGILQLLEPLDGRVLIVLDEVENVTGADALRALDALVADLPASVSILLNARGFPDMNLSLLSVRGRCTFLKPDLLRFRTWEIDDLFHSVYGVDLAPYELAELERRTGGWAAGLQLFHLATEHGGRDLRKQTLAAMGGRRGPSWEFLARNVVDALPPDLRGFLLDVVGMRRLRADLCDELRGTDDSADRLEELASKHLFVTPATDGDGYLVHEVLGAHLRGRIVHDRGEAELDRCHADAAALLEGHGFLAEAFEAYARAGHWDDARRILQRRDGSLDERLSWVIEQVPEGVMKDPWWTLASARRHRGEGRLDTAIATYQRVEDNELSDAARATARQERLQLVGFLRPNAPTADRWIAVARDALAGVGEELVAGDDPTVELANALVRLLAGRPVDRSKLTPPERAGLSRGLQVAAASVETIHDWADGRAVENHLVRLDALIELGVEPWFERLGTAVAGLVTADQAPIDVMAAAAADNDDPFGRAIADLLCRLLRSAEGVPFETPSISPVLGLERWAANRARHLQRDREVADRPVPTTTGDGESVSPAPGVQIHGFGGLRVEIDGEPIDLGGLRPQARDVLRQLVAAAGAPVHEEVIVDALWPDDGEKAKPRLQTAISGCRKTLAATVGEAVRIVRTDHSYRLEAADAEIDVEEFHRLARQGLAAVGSDPDVAAPALSAALQISAEEFLPECGPADWAVQLRNELARTRVRVAVGLADSLRAGGDLRGAAAACERGLDADPFDPGLWSTLLDLTESSGDDGWHALVSARHASMVDQLEHR